MDPRLRAHTRAVQTEFVLHAEVGGDGLQDIDHVCDLHMRVGVGVLRMNACLGVCVRAQLSR